MTTVILFIAFGVLYAASYPIAVWLHDQQSDEGTKG